MLTKRRLGRQGLEVAALGLGCMGILARDLEGYDKTKSSLHFSPEEPLPATLVRKLIKARIAEIEK